MGRLRTAGEVAYALVIGGLAALALVILVGPILVVLATSFTDSRSIRFPPTGFSIRWYELLDGVRSRQIHRAAGNTAQVAALAAGLATLLGTAAAALALSRAAGRGARAAPPCACGRGRHDVPAALPTRWARLGKSGGRDADPLSTPQPAAGPSMIRPWTDPISTHARA